MYNAKLRKNEVGLLEAAIERYDTRSKEVGENCENLFLKRQSAVKVIEKVTAHINALSNVPHDIAVQLKKTNVEIQNFTAKQVQVAEQIKTAKIAARGAGAGASVGAAGVAVATLGPTAAMGIATTFGVASTGTAISSLSGAAATSAALAWLGGGTVAAGAGGMAGGTALLALAGPVGWAIAGVGIAASVGTGIFASKKNKDAANQALDERERIEIEIRKLEKFSAEIDALTSLTREQTLGLSKQNKRVPADDYSLFNADEKREAMVLVNNALTLAQFLNKEIDLTA